MVFYLNFTSDLPDLSVASNKRIAWIHSALLEVGSGSVSSSGTLAERTAACAAILHTRALEQRKGAKLSAGSSDGQSYAADAEVTETLSDTVVGETSSCRGISGVGLAVKQRATRAARLARARIMRRQAGEQSIPESWEDRESVERPARPNARQRKKYTVSKYTTGQNH